MYISSNNTYIIIFRHRYLLFILFLCTGDILQDDAITINEDEWIVGTRMAVTITSVGQNGSIYITNTDGPSRRIYEEMEVETRIQEYGRSSSKSYRPSVNELCIALSCKWKGFLIICNYSCSSCWTSDLVFSTAKMVWGRAICYRSYAGQNPCLHFLDLGYNEDIPHTQVRHMPTEFIEYKQLAIEAIVLSMVLKSLSYSSENYK